MNRLILLAATLILAPGFMLGQSSPEAIENTRPNAAPDQTQRGTQATPPIVPHQPPDTTANPDRPRVTPETTLPNTTIDDQQPGNSTTGSPSSTMGTTGSTPGTDQTTEGSKCGTTPNNKQKPPETNAPEPHEAYPSGSSNPSSSANGAGSNDMSGTNPRPDNTTNSTNPQTTPPHITSTHVPDPGTEMNPAAVELPANQEAPIVKQMPG